MDIKQKEKHPTGTAPERRRRRCGSGAFGICLALASGLTTAAAAEISVAAAPLAKTALPVLTNAQQVLDLGLERARSRDIPVRLRGVMTYQAVNKPDYLCLEDDSAAILVTVMPPPSGLVSGQLIEVQGVAAAGIYAPCIVAPTVKLLGMAPLPAPRHTAPSQLAAGSDFLRWVTVQATVRDAAVTKNRIMLLCAAKGLHFQVWSTHRDDLRIPVELLDARVELQGVAWTDVGYERQPYGFKLQQPGTNCIKVLQPGSAAIFDHPTRSVQSLRLFTGDGDARVKVTGVVTLHSPTGLLYVQDETGGLCARQLAPLPQDDDPRGQFLPRAQPALQPGDRIELVGSPTGGHPFAPALVDAEYRVIGRTEPPRSRTVSVTELMSGIHDAQPVSLKARVVDIESHSGKIREEKLWLQADELVFEAMFDPLNATPLQVRRNDFVEVSGVCAVQPGQLQQVRSFSLRLRGPADLKVAVPPGWWTSRWAVPLLLGAAAILAGALVWITLLRRQVAASTASLRETNTRLQSEIAVRAQTQDRLARFKAVAEATTDLVAMATLDGSVLYVNTAGRRMVGMSLDGDLTGMKISEFYPEWTTQLFREQGFAVSRREGAWSAEVAVLHKDGREIPVSMVGLTLRSAEGQPEYLACIIREISDRRRMEEEMQRALEQEKELSALKSQFISMVSHEIRTPLALILSSSEILHHYFERLPEPKRTQHLETIHQAVHRMSTLIEDVLIFSRAEAGRLEFKPEPLEFGVFCGRLVDEIQSATARRNPIELTLPEAGATARLDVPLVRHILTNLLTNAVKYSPPNAPILLEVSVVDQEAVFRVQDRGIGIPEADRKRLFTPFYRGGNAAHIPGTGLGLLIVKRCVERHAGRLEIESQEGVGTTVAVFLPKLPSGHTEFLSKTGPENSSVAL